MAKSRSSLKRARQSRERAARNLHVRSTARGAVRRVRTACAAGNAGEAREHLREAVRLLDRAAAKRVLHRNAAARRKSRLAKLVAGVVEQEPNDNTARQQRPATASAGGISTTRVLCPVSTASQLRAAPRAELAAG